jgi:hypothetical protein
MKLNIESFDEQKAIEHIRHYLPSQSALKDFVHHNTLHAFQEKSFFDACEQAQNLLGCKTLLSHSEYVRLYHEGKINPLVLKEQYFKVYPNAKDLDTMFVPQRENYSSGIGKLRNFWKEEYKINVDKKVHPVLFKLLANYLDQGVASITIPKTNASFLESVMQIQKHSVIKLFKSQRAAELCRPETRITELLEIVVGNAAYFETYLMDMLFAHSGWSGMVAQLEENPTSLIKNAPISLNDLIRFELCLEIDALDNKYDQIWRPIGEFISPNNSAQVEEVRITPELKIWHNSMEWSYYHQVLQGIKNTVGAYAPALPVFQAYFCIDDRMCSLRRHLEKTQPHCKTYGTPGFFNVEFNYKPLNSIHSSKVCPAPMTTERLIKETSEIEKPKDNRPWIYSLIFGNVFSPSQLIKIGLNIFKPTLTVAAAHSFRHTQKEHGLTIENNGENEDGLSLGFTLEEMADRMETLFKSTGLVKNFSNLIYFIGHGSSSTNNPYYAGYDCGACNGRPGSVNARVAAYMCNKREVRDLLLERGINIPSGTQFIAGLHDTCRDEIKFYNEDELSRENALEHSKNADNFSVALDWNAKERNRRFELTAKKKTASKVHTEIKKRSVSMFEPRPELNHSTNALCIVGRRQLTRNLFLDRRAFLNSYDAKEDPKGKYLLGILKAAAPVCGGINLEYFFSRTDNQRLGSGTKLSHNVLGLIGLANGSDGDLRPGLPIQMIEVHDPLRLLMVVEHNPQILLQVISSEPNLYEWFNNNWIHLVSIHPMTKEIFVFENGDFVRYKAPLIELPKISDMNHLLETEIGNIPVMELEELVNG